MNRIASLLSGGTLFVSVAIYYNAESHWAGKAMELDVIARKLYDRQIDYLFLPLDELEKASRFEVVLVPEAEYVPVELAKLPNAVFIESLPGNYDKAGITEVNVVPLDKLADYLDNRRLRTVGLTTENNRLRCCHYLGEEDLYFFVNEGTEEYVGTVEIPNQKKGYFYLPWENEVRKAVFADKKLQLRLRPRESVVFVNSDSPAADRYPELETVEGMRELPLGAFRRSVCEALSYPAMSREKSVSLPDEPEREYPDFSGFIRYETELQLDKAGKTLLFVGDADQSGIEILVNHRSIGLFAWSPVLVDITEYVHAGENTLCVELSTTLERDSYKYDTFSPLGKSKPQTRSGLSGCAVYV